MEFITGLEAMVAEQPTNARAWYMLGSEYARFGETAKALMAFSRAMEHCDETLRPAIMQQLSQLAGAGASATEPAPAPPPAPEPERPVRLRVLRGGAEDGESREPAEAEAPITFADVGGLEDLKQTIQMKIIQPFFNVGLFAKFRKKAGGGILLYGPPGCGKTFIARATAGECRARFISVRITDILDPYQGVSERNLKDHFDTARARRPAVLFFDELDALAFNRSKSNSHYLRGLTDLFLNELDGMQADNDKIMVVGATNLPWDVDPAFKRPGRFDRMVFVPPPDETARETIFRLKLQDRPLEGVDARQLARETELYSGADIENAVERATENVLAEILATGQERPVRQEDLLRAVRQTSPSTVDWLRTVKNYVRYANQGGLYDDVEAYLNRVKRLI